VRIVGDISKLGMQVTEDAHDAVLVNKVMAVDAAREAVLATLLFTGLTEDTLVATTTTRDLLRILLKRAWIRASGQAGRPEEPLTLANQGRV